VSIDVYLAYDIESFVEQILWLVMLGVQTFATADALMRKDAFFVAADKQNKAFWLLMLAVFLALRVLIHDPQHILNLIGSVIAFVYLADVRPILRSMQAR
jgi:hypothetical protein